MVDRRERADRILDTAKDLLLRWGYRRVTIDEIADRAGVGKGTVYLHWRTRDQIFLAAAMREAGEMTGAVAAAMAADPAEIRLDRYMRRYFIETMARPVLRAVFTRDGDTLGKLLAVPAFRTMDQADLAATRTYLDVLAGAGLLRAGLRPADLDYPLRAIVYGFFALDPFLAPDSDLTVESKADHLADTLRRTFGPAREPGRNRYATAAPKVVAVFEQLARDFRTAAYGGSDE